MFSSNYAITLSSLIMVQGNRMAMTAMTTGNSIKVKARRVCRK